MTNHEHHPVTQTVLELFHARGSSQYGSEAVSQMEHALQAAALAEHHGASLPLVAAALLHDVGHLLHDLPDDAPELGLDDRHEILGERWLARHFMPETVEPVRLHVDAKRYLCATDPTYLDSLSEPSRVSLKLQGGPFNPDEQTAFMQLPYAAEALSLRRWDDRAKVPSLPTPPIEHYAKALDAALLPARPA